MKPTVSPRGARPKRTAVTNKPGSRFDNAARTSLIEIQASFRSEQEAQEALHKLQALRAAGVGGYQEGGGILTATVDESIAERAVHLIQQVGGSVDTKFS